MYRLEQLFEYDKYKKLCDCFFSLELTEKEVDDLKEILFEGSFNQIVFSTSLSRKDNPMIELQRRSAMAYLYLRNRDTFMYLVNNNAFLFHGTNSLALPSILEKGLSSVNMLKEKDIEIKTGEEWSRIKGNRDFISLTDVLGYSEAYSLVGTNNEVYPVLFAIDDQTASKYRTIRVGSAISEVGISKNILPYDIKIIMVPSQRIEEVYKMINNSDIKVLPFDLNEKFFWYDYDEFDYLCIDDEKFEQFRNFYLNRDSQSFEDDKTL